MKKGAIQTLVGIVLATSLALGGCLGSVPPSQPVYSYQEVGIMLEMPQQYYKSGVGLAAADFDLDGDTDLAYLVGSEGQVWLYKNNGDGAFEKWGVIAQMPSQYYKSGVGLAAGDFVGDEYPDLAFIVGSEGHVIIYEHLGDGLGGVQYTGGE